MIWQDVVIGVGQTMFSIALWPSLISDEKPARATCALSAVTLFVFGFVYITLGMLWAAASVLICGALWAVLLFQRRR